MRKVLLRVALCVLLIESGLWAHASGGNNKELIVPGKSIGKAKLGPEEQADKVLGDPAFSDMAMGRGMAVWYGKPDADGKADATLTFSVYVDGGTRRETQQIGVTSAFFHTKEEISVKSTLADIWRTFPNLRYSGNGDESHHQENVELYDDESKGIAFAIERIQHPAPGQAWGQCCAIMIHKKGDGASSFYIPSREVPQKTE